MRHPILLLLLALCATPSHASPQIPVTETWGDLLQRPPLRAGQGWVRLGLEARESRPGSSILVYALFEGPTGPGRGPRSGAQLGPLEVVAVRELQALRKELEVAKRLQRFPQDALNVLYATALRVPERGRARYEVRAGARVLARFALAAKGEPDQPWFVVRAPQTAREELLSTDDTKPESLRISGARASARWPGDEALRWETPRDLIPLAEELPRATPRRALLGARLDAAGALVLDLEAGLGQLEERLLARVWIRGLPVHVRQKQRQEEAREGLLRKLERRVRVRLELDLESGALGARAGDQVEVQLLYSPRGVDLEGDRCEQLRTLSSGAPALSKRFVLRKGRVDLGRVLQRLPSWKSTRDHPCVRLLPE